MKERKFLIICPIIPIILTIIPILLENFELVQHYMRTIWLIDLIIFISKIIGGGFVIFSIPYLILWFLIFKYVRSEKSIKDIRRFIFIKMPLIFSLISISILIIIAFIDNNFLYLSDFILISILSSMSLSIMTFLIYRLLLKFEIIKKEEMKN